MAGDRGLLLLFLLSAAALAGVASAAAPFLSGECVLVLLAANFAILFAFVTAFLTFARAWVCRRRVPGDRRIHGEELVAGQEGYVSFSFLLNSSTL